MMTLLPSPASNSLRRDYCGKRFADARKDPSEVKSEHRAVIWIKLFRYPFGRTSLQLGFRVWPRLLDSMPQWATMTQNRPDLHKGAYMRPLCSILGMVLLGTSPTFAASSEALRLIDQAAAVCQSFEDGEFDAGDAVKEIELRSQFGTVEAELVDESEYACSSAASLYCGTGGCMLNLIVDGRVQAWQATGWRLVEWGPDRILLIGRDGGWCGGAGAEVCYEALVWSNGRILTVGPAPEVR